jgi:hypothetical protein
MVRDLGGTINQHRAEMGVFICLTPPTPGMREVAQRSGTYLWPITGRSYPRTQIVTVEELLSDMRPDMPPALLPYLQAKKLVADNQLSLGL